MRRLTRYFRWPKLRQRRQLPILWPLLILLAAFVGFLQLLSTDGGTASTATPGPFDSPTPLLQTSTPTPPSFFHSNPQSLQQATVQGVIDGDTIDVLIGGESKQVRYYGIDAPDKGEDCYEEATVRNRELLGTTVRLEADARNEDEYGRLLRYVFTNDGISLDGALVSQGLAKAWRDDGRYATRLTILETYAREHRIGCLWK
jgi:endonuclease YncB( thermonuclease family)